ncbi:MAG: hypothetical protein JWP89_1420 [Schlesneria sp.]|nr:hypothetical protein [Schlesneria sp.]
MSESPIRTDATALAMVGEYRRRFSSAPIGTWVDCIDNFIGMGFSGVSGKFSDSVFFEDGTGTTADADERILFEWRAVGDRVIELRCIEHIPALEGWTEQEYEEDRQWHRVEYDFVVPTEVNVPTIVDAEQLTKYQHRGARNLQFLECITYRFGGPLRLGTGRDDLRNLEDLRRILCPQVLTIKRPWWKFW